MAIFPDLKVEPVVQVNDLTRLDARSVTKSIDEAAITLVEIEPESGAGFIDVSSSGTLPSSSWYLDWAYSTNGSKTASVRVTTSGAPVSLSKTINVLTEAEDSLFSSDSDLIIHEPDILNWVREGRRSFLDYHRRSQELILDYLRINGYRTIDGSKITKAELLDKNEFKEWSVFLTLKLIMESRSNQSDDIFLQKARFYESKVVEARASVFISYDFDKDGSIGDNEKNIFNTSIGVDRS